MRRTAKKRSSKTITKSKAKTQLKLLTPGSTYVYKLKLSDGRTIDILDAKLGKFAAVSYNAQMGFGNIFNTKAEAQAYLGNPSEGFTSEIIKPYAVSLLKVDGTQEKIPQKGFLAAIKRLLGGK